MKIEDFIGMENKFMVIYNSHMNISYVAKIHQVAERRLIAKMVWNNRHGCTNTQYDFHVSYEEHSIEVWKLIDVYDEFPKELLI